MPTVKAMLQTHYKSKYEIYPIVIRVWAGSQKKELPVGFKVKESQWNGSVIKHPDKEIINAKIADKLSEVNKFFTHCISNNIQIDLNRLNKPITGSSFTAYLLHRAKAYDEAGQPTIAGRVRWAVKELKDLFGEVLFTDIHIDLIRKYHASLKSKIHANTIHKRLAMLRQLFANAVNEGVYAGANPFTLFKVKQEPVNKAKLSVEDIGKIESAELFGGAAIARDLFLFSYYCKGIRFENCVFMQWKDIKDNRIYITTNKGKKHISIKVHDKLQQLLHNYKGKGFVFPYVNHIPDVKRKVLDGVNIIVNSELKVVAAAAGLRCNLTFHIARHSIAYHLKQSGVGINAIKDILGHSTVSITERYLKELDDKALDLDMLKVYKK